MRRVKETVHYFCNDTLFGHIDGHGVTTAVLDTGISPHPDLKGRIVAFGDMLYGKKRMYDDNSHGTHVAPHGCRENCRHTYASSHKAYRQRPRSSPSDPGAGKYRYPGPLS